MGNPENPAPASKASTAIIKIKTSIQQVETKIGKLINICDTLKNFPLVLTPLRILPVAGTITGRAVSALERLDIEGKIERIAEDIKTTTTYI
ncbi:hypothetical protein COCC4DRAFT_151719 [Bipolaris maydis ATCC 48331]|uniref:Uncharacterized protein n=2 Tax=Cochliobolus heterostrophus TaxID=5016 RepID=M2UCF0_COCH5|nr:uncharacterized protein COCC4DRAFT_151719 [Bipolaris maydis ATCC 48331]EMD85592.1 hypothetical protein COCHEDRAFT_1219295 [Bipolaris maydis C5]ENH99956.1 hypothetical protein COCC4DRAFT_151719 [Bipolaris maydis ATCC 48331]KAH7559073.1 hypothetical protein BM1_04010 [Bipolaris maydis]